MVSIFMADFVFGSVTLTQYKVPVWYALAGADGGYCGVLVALVAFNSSLQVVPHAPFATLYIDVVEAPHESHEIPDADDLGASQAVAVPSVAVFLGVATTRA